VWRIVEFKLGVNVSDPQWPTLVPIDAATSSVRKNSRTRRRRWVVTASAYVLADHSIRPAELPVPAGRKKTLKIACLAPIVALR
jgi:hypothetical protein